VQSRLSHTAIINARLVSAIGLWLCVLNSVPSMLKPYKIESDPAEDASLSGPESIDEKFRYWFGLVVARASRACLHKRDAHSIFRNKPAPKHPVSSWIQKRDIRDRPLDVVVPFDLTLLRAKPVDAAPRGIRGSKEAEPTTGD
jgi:hypothetical protein